MSNIKKTEELRLDDSVKLNRKGEAILGRLTGPCADIVNPTRNERFYSEQLWEKVFQNPIVNEYFQAGGILGELNHPADRVETDLEKVAICMPEPPTKDNEGHLVGSWDILDTPNGRIAYTLAKYGYKLGISSRGNGDVVEDYNGTERVDEDTYDFQAFDLVLLPAVKAARLQLSESLQQNGKTFKQAICEALETASADDKKVMTETLNNLNIDYSLETVDNKKVTAPIVESVKSDAAENIGVDNLKDLTEALKENQSLEKQIKELQEKLSVCYAKETNQEEEISKLKNVVISLTESVKSGKAAKTQVTSLQEQLEQANKKIETQRARIKLLYEHQSKVVKAKDVLNESVQLTNTKIKELQSQIQSLNEQLDQAKQNTKNSTASLTESIEILKKDSAIKKAEFDSKLATANQLVEKYKRVAKATLNKLIESKAIMLGISADEIRAKLPNNYSFNDIESICESLKHYQVSLSKLPLALETNPKSKIKMKVTEAADPLTSRLNTADDVVDDSLLALANLK